MREAGYANLLPELLLALVGHTGEAFVRHQDGMIALAEGLVDWCTPPERCGERRGCPGPTLPCVAHLRCCKAIGGVRRCAAPLPRRRRRRRQCLLAAAARTASPARLPVRPPLRPHAPSRAQLDRLAALGAHYAALEAFVEAAAAAAAEGAAAAAPCSLYRLALANGVSELLDVYRSAVLAVEAHLARAAAAPPLLAVQQFLLEWEVLLPEAAALVGEVEGAALAGAAVMRLLALRAHSGVPALQSCAQRLLWHCRQVLFKQLESWLVHGLLLDRAGEFFIRRAGASGGSSPRHSAASPSPLRLGDGGSGAAGPMLDWEPLEWHAGFEVRRLGSG